MKNFIKSFVDNKWLVILALFLSLILNYAGHCYITTSQYDCSLERDYYTFDTMGFIINAVGIYVVLLIGSTIGKATLRKEIKDKIEDKGYVGSTVDKISKRNQLKIPFEHYEAIRKYFYELIGVD